MFGQLPSLLLLIFGFGFVIFFHELGHFLAAKWVGIKVEQFAVGFGHAVFSWRKGLGLRIGSSTREYEEKVARSEALGISETEYRLNWIPLGGYVKMLGQDDLNPNAQHDDPRAYNKKSIGARMIVVSAGVIMNVILAAVGFMAVFLIGFNTQPPIVGAVMPGSPAALTTKPDGTAAPLQVGDRILMFDGKWQHSFDKIQLNVALSGDGPVPLYVRRYGGKEERLLVRPARTDQDASDFLLMGIGPVEQLRGLDAEKLGESPIPNSDEALKYVGPDFRAVLPGETITRVNGKPVRITDYSQPDAAKLAAIVADYHDFYETLQHSNGEPITLTVVDEAGKVHERTIRPRFASPFTGTLNFAGMEPRATIEEVLPNSSAKDKLLPNDVVERLTYEDGGDTIYDPTVTAVRDRLAKAGETQQAVDFIVLRDGKQMDVPHLVANVRLPGKKKTHGLNIALSVDEQHPVVASTLEKSSAANAGIPSGATITAIDGQPVKNWFDVRRLLAAASADHPVKIAAATENGPTEYSLKLSHEDVATIAGMSYTDRLELRDQIEPRKTSSPIQAATWGVSETRDFILQFYLTLDRMFRGQLSVSNMMGPVGIFNAGRHFAYKGIDWLIWFLAMISANLAVVNFLPIPIVDGGLFTFLIVEKIQGRPLSAKTQSIAQFVGLAIILSVFLLVTYQDIARMAF